MQLFAADPPTFWRVIGGTGILVAVCLVSMGVSGVGVDFTPTGVHFAPATGREFRDLELRPVAPQGWLPPGDTSIHTGCPGAC
ncbi:hypothetical protein [Amycolatopsis rifamycinica]|uniref:Uncharacterized protein n=1 Tax=Amycolatopsis rifamycinica TaxID=287986 RepID=A0A066UBK9_9PSEU|nr:hypothetical protein [Amycolatopsis rifamycinica]KDN23232.1 hypothetical protein DV20_05810 [Amycolatopsis rifamycinica]